MKWYVILPISLGAIVFLAAVVWGLVVSNVETPEYALVDQQGQIEIRDYSEIIVAEASIEGDREEAIYAGFRLIANYIFGNNLSTEKVAMTAPVTQQTNETIAMTAPVSQQSNGRSWKVRFVMPSVYTIETLPVPNNPEVKIISTPPKRYIAIRFSGFANNASIQENEAQLREFLAERSINAVANPVYAFYNDPWTLPFMRRNEVMIEIAQ